MRFKIILRARTPKKFLPVDYQYFISSWVYKSIGEEDEAFAAFLHEQGYTSGNKRFKLFNFSPLDIRPFKLHRQRGVFELLSDGISFEFSCALPEIAVPLIKGIFANSVVNLGDRINQVDFEVSQIELLPTPVFEDTMHYRVKSLCVVTRPPVGDERYGQYLFPKDEDFARRLAENLAVKCEAAAMAITGTDADATPNININVATQYKHKKITIKPFTPQQTQVKGSLFDCVVTGPEEVQKLLWEVGLGEKNSMGCGWVEVK